MSTDLLAPTKQCLDQDKRMQVCSLAALLQIDSRRPLAHPTSFRNTQRNYETELESRQYYDPCTTDCVINSNNLRTTRLKFQLVSSVRQPHAELRRVILNR